LARRGEQKAFGNDGKTAAHLHVRCNIIHSRQRADAKAAIRQCLDPRHVGQTIYVQHMLGKRDVILHQTDEVRAAGDESEVRVLRVRRNCCRWIGGS